MSEIGRTVLTLTEQANELGYDSLDEAIEAGYRVSYYGKGYPILIK